MFTYADVDCDGCINWEEFQTMINPPKPADQFEDNPPKHSGHLKMNPTKSSGQFQVNPPKNTVQWASRPTKTDLAEKTTLLHQALVPIHPLTLSVTSIMHQSDTNIPIEGKPF